MKTLFFVLIVMTCCIATGCSTTAGYTAVQPAVISNGADQGVPAPAPQINSYSYRHNDDKEDLLRTIEDRVRRVKRILNSF